MAYCPYCGKQVGNEMLFCPYCGSSLANEVRSYTLNDVSATGLGEYKVFLAGLGTAKRSRVEDLLEDVLGYTALSADRLTANIPVQIADNLSLKQAAVVAQIFEEYGAQVAVAYGDDVRDISDQTSSYSLFNSDGSFLASAAMILATLSAANRLRSITKPKKPSLLERIFHSLFTTRKKPPVHVRRTITPRNIYSRPVTPPRQERTIRQQLRPAPKRPEPRQFAPAQAPKKPATGSRNPGFGTKTPGISSKAPSNRPGSRVPGKHNPQGGGGSRGPGRRG